MQKPRKGKCDVSGENEVRQETKYCQCNIDQLQNLQAPLFRFVCHCKTCQDFFGAPFNDECTFLLNDCTGVDLKNIEFRSYQKGFSPIKRGKCKSCGKAAFCMARVWPYPAFLMVPSEALSGHSLPRPLAHIYYHSRVASVKDSTKKINGHFRGQIAIQAAIAIAILKRLFSR